MKKAFLILGLLLSINSCFAVEKMAVEKANVDTPKTLLKLAQSVEKNSVLSINDCVQLAL